MEFSDPWIFVSVFPTKCPAGTIVDVMSGTCLDCPKTYDSPPGQVRCIWCDELYYFNDNTATCESCPDHATCRGRDAKPIPDEGYWVSYDSVEHAHRIFECHKGTCAGGGDTDSRCWTTANYSKCDADELQCSEGATGILCGACEAKFTYNKINNACVECTR
jgi:hypothetical protein